MYDVVQAAVFVGAIFDRQRIELFGARKGIIERTFILHSEYSLIRTLNIL